MVHMWPTCLRLEILDIGICTVDIQTWIHKNHAPVVRIKSVPGMDVGDFDELVKSLRNRGAVSPNNIPLVYPLTALIVCDCEVEDRRQ